MDILEIMKARHSVRQYSGKRIESGMRETLTALVSECNTESGLNIQIIFDEPKCFDSMMAENSAAWRIILRLLEKKKLIWMKRRDITERSLY